MSAIPTIAEAISYGDVSVYLAANDNSDGALYGKRLAAPRSPITIAYVTDALRWQYDGSPADTTLRRTANYLIWLCGKYGAQANAIINGTSGGGTVNPPSSGGLVSPVPITGSDFANATDWNGAGVGFSIAPTYTLQVFWNDVNRFLTEGTEWQRTSTGIKILMAGFDATTTNIGSTFYIYISP